MTSMDKETKKEVKAKEEVNDNETLEAGEVRPLDGGWAWVVMVASFISSVIVDGVCFSFGIFYLEFLDHFHENKGKTAWIGSVLNGMYMIMGPIAAALANTFGCRPVAIVGGVWSALAFFLSTLSPNIDVLIVTYGILGGMGFGLLYLPSIVVVGFYFDKRRALATGIATCGSGIGAFIFAPMCQRLIQVYAWQGAQWILAGIVLNGVVLGSLYRPLTPREVARYFNRKWHGKRRHKALEPEEETCLQNDATRSDDRIDQYSFEINKSQCNNTVISQHLFSSVDNLTHSNREHIHQRQMFCSHPNLSFDHNLPTVHKLVGVDSWHSLCGFASLERLNHALEADSPQKTANGVSSSHKQLHSCSQISSTQTSKGCLHVFKVILKEVSKSMDISILKNPVFVIYGISCILCMNGFFVPFIYLIDKAVEASYSESQAALLLSILGITNTVGRVAAGWVSDQPWADCLLINNVALIIGGIATILVPFCYVYWLLTVYASIFGLCIAAFVSLRSIILVDLIGLTKLTSSFGILVMCQGISSFVGAPIAGSLYDLTGTYDVSFYVAGTTITMAGLICLPLRQINKRQGNKERPRDSSKLEKETSHDSSA